MQRKCTTHNVSERLAFFIHLMDSKTVNIIRLSKNSVYYCHTKIYVFSKPQILNLQTSHSLLQITKYNYSKYFQLEDNTLNTV